MAWNDFLNCTATAPFSTCVFARTTPFACAQPVATEPTAIYYAPAEGEVVTGAVSDAGLEIERIAIGA